MPNFRLFESGRQLQWPYGNKEICVLMKNVLHLNCFSHIKPPKCNKTSTLTKRDSIAQRRPVDNSQTLDVLSETLTVFDVESTTGT